MATDSFCGVRVERKTNGNIWACVGLRIVKWSHERFSTSLDARLEVLVQPSQREVSQYDEIIDDCNGGIGRVYSHLLRSGKKIDFCVEVTSVVGAVCGPDNDRVDMDTFGFSASAVLGAIHLLREMRIIGDEKSIQGLMDQQLENWRTA